MTETADKPFAFAPRAWGWYAPKLRLAPYLALQALIAIVFVLLLRQPQPEPPASLRLTAFDLRESGSERAVTLPHFTASRFAMHDPPVYTTRFSEPDDPRAWSVLLPRFTNGVEVAVNGVAILDSRRDPAANRPDRNTPEIAVIPASLLHKGDNVLSIRLFVWGPLTGYLDPVYLGPDEVLRRVYDKRIRRFITLPVVFSAWQAILAVILTIMWLMRRHERAYGVLAAAMAIGAVQAFLPTPMEPSAFSRLNATLIASAPIEGALFLTFAILFFEGTWPRYGWLIFAPGLLVVVVGLFGGQPLVRSMFVWVGVPTVGLCLSAMAIVVARAVLRRQDIASLMLGCAATIALTCWVSDILGVLQVIDNGRIFVSRLSYSALLVAIGAGLTWRFARALNEVDSFASNMVTLVREAEDKLKASFAREEQRARAAALALERTRLMRDLHDGLGGQLVSIVALSERDNAGAPIGEAARAALKDLRLVIDAMDDIGGDLMLALGSWRERATAQLRPHDMTLHWQTLTPQGLPVHPELRPWHVIQIVRLLDEALTNAIKHAGARRITVTIETLTDPAQGDYGCITIADDGNGFALAPDGAAAAGASSARGLRNMKSRAARCGATLELASDAGGTRVKLVLPRRFPDGDAAG